MTTEGVAERDHLRQASALLTVTCIAVIAVRIRIMTAFSIKTRGAWELIYIFPPVPDYGAC